MLSGKHESSWTLHGLTRIGGFVSRWVDCLVSVIGALISAGYGLTYFWNFVVCWVGCVVRRAYKFDGWFTRIARGEP